MGSEVKSDFHGLLKKLGACKESEPFTSKYESAKEAWDKCNRADWMTWYLMRLHKGKRGEKAVLLVLAACAETALKYVPKRENSPAAAILALRMYAIGRGSKGVVETAAYAAYAAANAAYAAANAAANAAVSAAYAAFAAANAAYAANAANAAAYAAYAAAYAAYAANPAAKQESLAEMADMIRTMVPNPEKMPAAKSLWAPEVARGK